MQNLKHKTIYLLCALAIGCVGCHSSNSNENNSANQPHNHNFISKQCNHGGCKSVTCQISEQLNHASDGTIKCEMNVGVLVTFGHYEQDGNLSNDKEKIVWQVLEKSDSKVLLISHQALDVKPYNPKQEMIVWETSTIRSWLNGYDANHNIDAIDYRHNNFLNTAFTDAEKSKIATTSVTAEPNPKFHTHPGQTTNDLIFLLSTVDVQKYFKTDDERKADATRYTVQQNAYVQGSQSGKGSSNGSCHDAQCFSSWWLRSPGYHNFYATVVDYNGNIVNYGHGIHFDDVTIRPALWLNL